MLIMEVIRLLAAPEDPLTLPYIFEEWRMNWGTHLTNSTFFVKMHKKDKGEGEWCAEKAVKVAKKYEETMKEKLQSDGVEQSSEILFDPKVRLKVTGVSKNKQVYDQCHNAEFESLMLQLWVIVKKLFPKLSLHEHRRTN